MTTLLYWGMRSEPCFLAGWGAVGIMHFSDNLGKGGDRQQVPLSVPLHYRSLSASPVGNASVACFLSQRFNCPSCHPKKYLFIYFILFISFPKHTTSLSRKIIDMSVHPLLDRYKPNLQVLAPHPRRLTCKMLQRSESHLLSSQGWNIPRVTQFSRITSMLARSNHVRGRS